MSDELPPILQPESAESYQQDAGNYFRNLQDHKKPGQSADELGQAAPKLLSKKQEYEYAKLVERAADKTARSGARVNNASNVPGIFMQGMKETSELIDRFTPGKLEQPEEMKPPDQQIAPTGFFEKAEAVVEFMCLDCEKPMSKEKYVLGVTIATEEDSEACAGKVGYGGTVLYTICLPCFEAAKQLTKDKTPLVLVFHGELTDIKDIALAQKYGFPVQMHSGTEKTRGQWEIAKRRERLMTTLWEIIRQQGDDSLVFTRNRSKE